MRKISLLILCILFASKTNSIHAQTILTSEVTNQENQIVTEQDSIYEQSPINNTQDTINPQNNTPQKTNLSERIKQQAKATREKVITQISRNTPLSTTKNTSRTIPVNQVSEGVVTSQPETISEESTISTIGQKYRVAFNKLTDIQVKIENAINEIENSKKINVDTARETLQKSKESLVNSDNNIQRLEQISIHTELNSEIKASMSEAKKGLLDSKQYLSTILMSLKQATRAKATIQTGGQQDEYTTGGTDTKDQLRK